MEETNTQEDSLKTTPSPLEENSLKNTPSPLGEGRGEAGEAPEPDLRDRIIEAIKTVYDPEIPVNIYELGLNYEVNIGEHGKIEVLMTLTSPGCPAAGMLPGDVEEKVRSVKGTGDVKVEVTFEPPWDQSMMTDE